MIVFITLVLKYYFSFGKHLSCAMIRELTFVASLLVEKCRNYERTHFRANMLYWCQMRDQFQELQSSERSARLRCIRMLRHCCFSHCPENYLKIITGSVSEDRGRIFFLLQQKLKSLTQNKSETINLNLSTHLKSQVYQQLFIYENQSCPDYRNLYLVKKNFFDLFRNLLKKSQNPNILKLLEYFWPQNNPYNSDSESH